MRRKLISKHTLAAIIARNTVLAKILCKNGVWISYKEEIDGGGSSSLISTAELCLTNQDKERVHIFRQSKSVRIIPSDRFYALSTMVWKHMAGSTSIRKMLSVMLLFSTLNWLIAPRAVKHYSVYQHQLLCLTVRPGIDLETSVVPRACTEQFYEIFCNCKTEGISHSLDQFKSDGRQREAETLTWRIITGLYDGTSTHIIVSIFKGH